MVLRGHDLSHFIRKIEYDVSNHMPLMYTSLPQFWTDYQLSWDPLEFGNISRVSIDSAMVWTPDIVLFNK